MAIDFEKFQKPILSERLHRKVAITAGDSTSSFGRNEKKEIRVRCFDGKTSLAFFSTYDVRSRGRKWLQHSFGKQLGKEKMRLFILLDDVCNSFQQENEATVGDESLEEADLRPSNEESIDLSVVRPTSSGVANRRRKVSSAYSTRSGSPISLEREKNKEKALRASDFALIGKKHQRRIRNFRHFYCIRAPRYSERE